MYTKNNRCWKTIIGVLITLFLPITVMPQHAQAAQLPTLDDTVTISSHYAIEDNQIAKDIYRLSDKSNVTFIYNKIEKKVYVYKNSILQRIFTHDELMSSIKDITILDRKVNSKQCAIAMAGLGIVNSIIWGAAGVATGGVAAVVGGIVTGAVISAGGTVC